MMNSTSLPRTKGAGSVFDNSKHKDSLFRWGRGNAVTVQAVDDQHRFPAYKRDLIPSRLLDEAPTVLCDTLCMPERIDSNLHNRNSHGLRPTASTTPQCGDLHYASAIDSVAMGFPMELGVADPMPPLNAPKVSH